MTVHTPVFPVVKVTVIKSVTASWCHARDYGHEQT